MCELATRAGMGEKLLEFGYGAGIYKVPPYACVKVPVFSFEKLTDVDTHLGPEMKSTGEVLGVGKNLMEALYKGLVAAGYKMRKSGGVFVTVRGADKGEIPSVAKKFADLGFGLYATAGTAKALQNAGMKVSVVNKIHDGGENNSLTILESGKLAYVISTSERGRNPAADDVKIRRKATMLGVPCLTSLDTANALADALLSGYNEINTELVDINAMRENRLKLDFVKMQGAGNDSIYIDCMEREINCPESLPVALSDRHFGIGGEGVALIGKSAAADAKMRMFNLDGSEGQIGGNAIRCVAKYLYDAGLARKTEMTIETLSGVRRLWLRTRNGLVSSVRVDMGRAELEAAKIPVKFEKARVVNEPVQIGGKEWRVTCVGVGNPHAVTFLDGIDGLNLEEIGPQFENSPLFPERVNAEFVTVIDRRTLKMRVWERGSGETLACGTGACAAAAAAVLNGFCEKGDEIRVILRGGELIIQYEDDAVYLVGDCAKVFEGTIEI
jgi:carbamoyl-phosphate synthase large subunit